MNTRKKRQVGRGLMLKLRSITLLIALLFIAAACTTTPIEPPSTDSEEDAYVHPHKRTF